MLKIALFDEIQDILTVEVESMDDMNFFHNLFVEGDDALDFYSLGPPMREVNVVQD